uniref:Uncharacterized protein n=1 Tax=Rhizophora mucronata TaxID=61149 RepID=A0A2P2N506_RHIMU
MPQGSDQDASKSINPSCKDSITIKRKGKS